MITSAIILLLCPLALKGGSRPQKKRKENQESVVPDAEGGRVL